MGKKQIVVRHHCLPLYHCDITVGITNNSVPAKSNNFAKKNIHIYIHTYGAFSPIHIIPKLNGKSQNGEVKRGTERGKTRVKEDQESVEKAQEQL